ncbi:unnamed protein product [Dibothriocephalus latus]|uniref:Uncharacterized protein n=1 Tax=Dibothriocephalus latus TaxID=60516 RepID=A0A3P7LGM0_DIBLA|nr:unnamed protein product [Dibothriocephalus latus]
MPRKYQDYTATNIALKNLGDADAIFINSYYPVTLHRIENYVKDKSREGVVVAGKNLIHIRRVKASQGDVEFFYCYLDPAIPHIVLTYNVDWRGE